MSLTAGLPAAGRVFPSTKDPGHGGGDLDGVMVIPQDLALQVLAECERIVGVEDAARTEFARGDDPAEVFQRHKRL